MNKYKFQESIPFGISLPKSPSAVSSWAETLFEYHHSVHHGWRIGGRFKNRYQKKMAASVPSLMDSRTPIDVYSDVTFERLLWRICPQKHCLKSDRPCIISWCLISTLHYQALYHILRIDLSDARPSLLTRAFLWFSLFSWESTGLELLTIQVPFTTLFSWKTR